LLIALQRPQADCAKGATTKELAMSWSYEPPTGQKMPTEMLFTVNFVLR